MIPTSIKIGYPSRNRKRRINDTTTTATNAVQKNMVLIARSLRKDRRADPSEALRELFIFFMTWPASHKNKKWKCSFLSFQAQLRAT
jgi:hypothetical protein